MLSRLTFYFCLILPFSVAAQDEFTVYQDSVLNQVKLVNHIENLSAAMFFQNDYSAKAFYIDYPNGVDSSFYKNRPSLMDTTSIRLKISTCSDSTFIVSFNHIAGSNLIVDTCYFFQVCLGYYLIFPVALIESSDRLIEKTISIWFYGPTSNEAREVIQFWKKTEDEFYFCNFQ